MYQLGKVVMFSAEDLCDAFHISKNISNTTNKNIRIRQKEINSRGKSAKHIYN